MRRTHPRHLVALVLVLCLLLSCIPVAAAVSETHDIQLQEVPAAAEALQAETAELPELDTPAPDENLRVIIMFQEEPVIEKGYSTSGLSRNASAMAYRATLEKKQAQAMAAVNRALGQQLQVQYQFTLGVNGVATTVRYDQIAKIEALEYVREVYVENRYELDEESPDTATSGTMVGSYSAWADGYTGAGSRIAVIDTGLDLDHPSFDESCFLHGLELSAARFGKDMADYNLLTAEEVAEVLPKLHAAELYAGLTAGDLYRSAKVPFAFNYIDEDLDVTHDNDSQGDHGTHVSGIATPTPMCGLRMPTEIWWLPGRPTVWWALRPTPSCCP